MKEPTVIDYNRVQFLYYTDTCLIHEYIVLDKVYGICSLQGYDMEDAMILNKASYERGFGHGSVIKSEV